MSQGRIGMSEEHSVHVFSSIICPCMRLIQCINLTRRQHDEWLCILEGPAHYKQNLTKLTKKEKIDKIKEGSNLPTLINLILTK